MLSQTSSLVANATAAPATTTVADARRVDSPRPRIVIAGGGTGGHLVPGIALARALALRADVLFFSTGKPLEERLISGAGFSRCALPAGRIPRNILALPVAMFRAAHGFWCSWRALGRERADVVVGLGGFGAAAPILAGWVRGIPTVLLEQNVLPGRANRLLARLARQVHLQWDEARPYLAARSERVFTSGSPLRSGVTRSLPRANRAPEDYSRFGLSPAKLTLLVTGGSQGALSMNQHVVAALGALDADLRAQVQVLHLAGGNTDLAELRASYQALALQHTVLEFLDDMPAAYRVADLAIARAGGTTLAELSGAGVPAVLLPYPHAANRHQHANAQAFAQAGAGVMLDEEGLSTARFAHELAGVLGEPERLREMSCAASALGRPVAAEVIARHVLDLVANRDAGE